MIEICSFNAKTLTKTTFAPFAWFGWPMQIAAVVIETIRNAAMMTSEGRFVKRTGGKVKEVRIATGGLKDIQKQTVLRTCSLTPIKITTHYDSAEDFKKVSSF